MPASMSFHGDASTWVHLHDYGTERLPILAIDGDGYYLTISVFDSRPIADHQAFAQKLAKAAAEYLAAVERYATAQPAGTETTQAR
jgi:alkylation response protein AidB-like acyl-CoA dehydrogenase